jgi:hypothetical protein
MRRHHLSRREALESIVYLTTGAALVSTRLSAQPGAPSGVIRGKLIDGATGQPTRAKMRVVQPLTAETFVPASAIKTMPKNLPVRYFYANGSYEVAVPPGFYQIEAVRGIDYQVAQAMSEVAPGATRQIDLSIPPLKDMHAAGWYSGNTHTHYYYDLEESPEERVMAVPPAEALDVSIVSYARRNDSTYPSNRLPIGRLPQFSRGGTIVDMGQETRNDRAMTEAGYGHCMFINIPRLLEPVSTGFLSLTGKAPDFPTATMLCEAARQVGGTTLWCHNGKGMELPVAVACGKINAYNAADGMEAEWTNYYHLLNCGFTLPLSSGTDWWIYDHNRVYVKVQGPFNYDTWLAGLRQGRTFITNGPLLDLRVNGSEPGDSVKLERSARVHVQGKAVSRIPFEKLEAVMNGEVVAEASARAGREAVLEAEISAEKGGWIALRTAASTKTHAGYKVFSHTSPVYLRVAGVNHRVPSSAAVMIASIERSVEIIRSYYHFGSDADRALALGKFEEGRRIYARIAANTNGA